MCYDIYIFNFGKIYILNFRFQLEYNIVYIFKLLSINTAQVHKFYLDLNSFFIISTRSKKRPHIPAESCRESFYVAH